MKTAAQAITRQSRASFSEQHELAAKRGLYQKLLNDHRSNGKVVFSEQAEIEEQRKWLLNEMTALQKMRDEVTTEEGAK